MHFSSKHLDNIIRANNDNRLALFIGAGISKSSETSLMRLPNWGQLIDELKKDLKLDQYENDFLKIAQLYFLEFGEFTYYEKIKGYFPSNIEPSIVHKLIFEINPQCIITTNWDSILEKAIDNNGYVYNVICSDEDLVKSVLPNKIIKMHGDFKNHNIVFKEDDYLSYAFNFPLIENYVKSILSTHTVLFLGYSYNDVNLKQITKWLQNHSKISPPRYLVSFSKNVTQEKYLENHNITVLLLEKESSKYNSLDGYSKKIADFLDVIKNQKVNIQLDNGDAVIEYFQKKLSIFDGLRGVLLEQINKTLTNCGFVYTHDNLVLFKLYIDEMTLDYDKNQREFNAIFIEKLRDYDHTRQLKPLSP